jgi:glycosyltransferase involved in cell wall biosynthesis
MQPLHVAMIVARFPPYVGGSELQAHHLSQELSRQGIRVSLLTQRFSKDSPEQETLNGVTVHRLAFWAFGTPWESPAFILSALRQLKTLRPDITHAHMLSSPAVAAAAARQLWGIPAIAKGAGVEKIGEMGSAYGSLLRRAKLSYLSRHLDAVIGTVSLMNREYEEYGFRKQQIHQIPNGVDIDRFKPVTSSQKQELRRRWGLPEGSLLAIYTGRISPEKGVDILLESWAHRPETPEALLLILGEGPEREKLEKRGIPNVRWLGKKQNVADFLSVADILILPSRGEALSNSLLEAMATGVACIATNVGGTPEVLDHGKIGLLVPPEDSAALTSALDKLFCDPDLRQRFIQAGQTAVNEHYSIKTVAQSYIHLYEELSSRVPR